MKSFWDALTLKWEERQNRIFRRELGRELAGAACALPAVLPGDAEEKLWERISGRREWEAGFSPVARPRQSSTQTWLTGAVGLLTVLCLMAGLWMFRSQDVAPSQAYDGVKGDSVAPFARLLSLRYATVGEDGRLSPGGEVAEIKVGTPIVFSVEAEGVDPKVGHSVVLEYMTDSDGDREKIADYKLSSDREILRDGTRAVAFTPEAPGAYVFILSAREQGDRHADSVSFSVQVK